jgi:hypothetical protein
MANLKFKMRLETCEGALKEKSAGLASENVGALVERAEIGKLEHLKSGLCQ